MKNIVNLLTVVLVFLGCKANHNYQDGLYQFNHPTDTIFKKEIPTTGYSYKSDKSKEQQLGLENLIAVVGLVTNNKSPFLCRVQKLCKFGTPTKESE